VTKKSTESEATAKPSRYAVYFPAPVTVDHKLLADVLESLKAGRKSSDFLYTMAVRGWLQVLHGLSPQERAIQLRLLDLPSSMIEAVDTAVPIPQIVGLGGYQPAAMVNTPQPDPIPSPPPQPQAVPVKPAFGMSVPKNSVLGFISGDGGLS